MDSIRNPTDDQIRATIAASKHKAARKIVDRRNGDVWVWPAEQATHVAGAAALGVPYDRPAGGGDILVL